MDYFKTEDLPEPEFRNISDGFMVTIFWREKIDVGKGVGKGVGKEVGKELTGSIAEVLKLIQNRPEITITEISVITKYTRRTVERSISQLKNLYLIKRIGGRKVGKWGIVV